MWWAFRRWEKRAEPDEFKAARLSQLLEWQLNGLSQPRRLFPAEASYAKRISTASKVFVPLALGDLPDKDFHRDVSYILDALDLITARPDLAFESMFRVVETTLSRLQGTGTMKGALQLVLEPGRITPGAIWPVSMEMPFQTAEYISKRFTTAVNDHEGPGDPRRLHGRLKVVSSTEVSALVEAIKLRSSGQDDLQRRKNASFVRNAFAGHCLVGNHPAVELSEETTAYLLAAGLLYTARNERGHGESFSPFLSSRAKLKTYAHPFYLTIVSYALVMALWAESDDRCSVVDRKAIADNVATNMGLAKELFGAHWNS